jgi:diguanylate cyclase (GGDEF)-like protein
MALIYNTWLVGLSVFVAISVSYTALRLASRVANTELPYERAWLIAGAFVMGLGIWSMHFVGMLAFSVAVPLAYHVPATLASLAVSILTSGFALAITRGEELTLVRLCGAAAVMGAGIALVHYMGMAAISIVPAISFDPTLVALSIYIAVSASFVALWMFFRLRNGNSWQRSLFRVGAAVVMGSAISGMHYVGMAASRFAAGSYCSGGIRLDQPWLAASIGISAMALLAVTVVTAVYDSQRQSRARRHAQKLHEVNVRLQYQATHDALTGLPNRTLFIERLHQEISRAEHSQQGFAVFSLDLDRFKVVNDTLGNAVGDQLLRRISGRLSSLVRLEDAVTRSGGDDFLMLICGVATRTGAAAAATKIVHEFDKPCEIDGSAVHASASIGIALYPADGLTAETLVAHADEALSCAKDSGRNTFLFFDPGPSSVSQDRLDLESDLRRALLLQQLELHYQPKVDVVTGSISSVEALLRWRHPERGFVSPAEFIPLAEESGLMFAIDEWVLREGCRQAREWQSAGLPFIRVAVNVSPVNFRESRFLCAVRAALADFDLDARFLEVELTETTVMRDAESAVVLLEDLSRMGVVVSIDDFGTGYSSMSYLRKLPIDKLKIDRSFISDLATSLDAVSIVKAIISLAHSLRLKVVAEGVETAAQLDQLRQLGCDQYQGFLRCPAVLPAAIVAIMRTQAEQPGPSDKFGHLRTQSKLGVFSRRSGG